MAEPFDGLVHVSLGGQADPPQPILSAANHFGGKFSLSEFDALADAHFSCPAEPGLPIPPGDTCLRQKNFNFGGQKFARRAAIAAGLLSANAQRGGQAAAPGMTRALFTTISSSPRRRSGRERNSRILPGLLLAVQDQHAGGIALVERALGNLRWGQVEVEIGKAHG